MYKQLLSLAAQKENMQFCKSLWGSNKGTPQEAIEDRFLFDEESTTYRYRLSLESLIPGSNQKGTTKEES
jgi:hypothetical protein